MVRRNVLSRNLKSKFIFILSDRKEMPRCYIFKVIIVSEWVKYPQTVYLSAIHLLGLTISLPLKIYVRTFLLRDIWELAIRNSLKATYLNLFVKPQRFTTYQYARWAGISLHSETNLKTRKQSQLECYIPYKIKLTILNCSPYHLSISP